MSEQDNAGQMQGNEGQGEQSFNIPQEYAEKGWAKNAPQFKDHSEFTGWIAKRFDDQQEYLGGKVDKLVNEQGYIKPPNWENADEVKAFYERITPQDLNEYPTGDFQSEEAKTFFNQAFKEAGLSKAGASKMIEAFNQYQNQILEAATDKADYEKRMEGIFGKDFQKAKEPIDNMLTGLLTPEEMQRISDKLPNELVEVMYKISKGLADKYGHKEQPKGGTSPNNAGATKEEKAAMHAQYTKELSELSKRPHSMEEKQAILNKMVNLYR
jgi:hypothetical protein